MQIDLTLLGACRVLGGLTKGLTSDIVELGDALGPIWLDLRDRLADLRESAKLSVPLAVMRGCEQWP